jgi:hypothetical protein
MDGSASIGLEQALLGHSLGFAPMASPTQVYVALCLASTAPSETVRGLEASGGGYVRTPATFALIAGPSNIAANTTSVEFPQATSSWGVIGFFELWDAASGGNRLYWGQLVDPADFTTPLTITVSAGDIVRFSAGTLGVQAATGSGGTASIGAYLPLAGGTLTGPVYLAGDPTDTLQAATKQYVDAHSGSGGGPGFLPLSGGTMLGPLTLSGPPTAALHAATKAYADGFVPLANVGYAIGNIPGPIVSQGGIAALRPPAELIFQRNAFAATDGQDFRFRRITAFTGGTSSNINKCLEVEFGNTAGNGCQEWPFLVKAMNSSTSGGQLVSAYIQAWRNAGTGLTTGLITDVADFQGTPSSTSGQLTGMEWDLNATGIDDGLNNGRFGGIGVRQMVHAVFANMSSTINSEYTAGIWFGTGINGTASAYVDSLLCVQGGAGQPTLIRNFLDSRGAAPPPGVTDPVAAVRMAAGHIVDFNGGPALNSAPGRYLQYTTTGTPRLRYMAGAAELWAISDAGAFTAPHVWSNLTNAPLQVNVGTSADGAANDWLYGWTRWFGTITGGDPNSVFQVAANKLIWGDAAEIQGGNAASGLLVYTSTGGVTTAGNTAGRVGIHSYLAVAGQVGASPILGQQVASRAFVSSMASAYASASQGGLGGWDPSLNPSLGYFRGTMFAGLDNVWLASGATNYSALIGREIDIAIQTGSNTSTAYGILLVEGSDKQADGDDHDAIVIGSNNFAATHWKNGIAFGGTGLACSVTGALIKTVPTKYPSPHALAFTTGIDFSGATFSDAFLRGPSNNFVVDGQGNTSIGGRVGFYGTAPVAKQTGVAITAAGIHAALTALGLIAP